MASYYCTNASISIIEQKQRKKISLLFQRLNWFTYCGLHVQIIGSIFHLLSDSHVLQAGLTKSYPDVRPMGTARFVLRQHPGDFWAKFMMSSRSSREVCVGNEGKIWSLNPVPCLFVYKALNVIYYHHMQSPNSHLIFRQDITYLLSVKLCQLNSLLLSNKHPSQAWLSPVKISTEFPNLPQD